MKCRDSLRVMLDTARRKYRGILDRIQQEEQNAAGTSLSARLDEAIILGRIQLLEELLEDDPNGWPHDGWFQFLDARAYALLSMSRDGVALEQMIEQLNLKPDQARGILEYMQTHYPKKDT